MKNKSQPICKVYSRGRIVIFKNRRKSLNRYSKKQGKLVYVLIVILIAFGIYFIMSKSVEPIFESICKDKAKAVATKITNEETTIAMKDHSYNDMFNIEKDESRKYTNDKCQYDHNR